MKKVNKTKKGFTLVEMVLVIAIILILATVILIGVNGIVDKARLATEKLNQHIDNTNTVLGDIRADLAG